MQIPAQIRRPRADTDLSGGALRATEGTGVRVALARVPVARVLVAMVLVGVLGACGAAPQPGPGAITPVTSTTKIAGAGVLGNDRRPDESCAVQPAPVDDGPAERIVRHAAGQTEVHADPQRIVVLSGDELDALCALGLQARVVASALPDGSVSQPSYMGTVVHDIPGVGTRSAPDLPGVAAAKPDLILGSVALTPAAYPGLTAIAPTVFAGPSGAPWRETLRTVGAATGRVGAADRLLGDFAAQAAKTGADDDAAHFQVSVVTLTETTMRVYGADNFPASVLGIVGLDRPATQRFTDKPYIEIGTGDADLPTADFSLAEGDVIYVSFSSPAARDRAATVLDSPAWRKLSANHDNRVFAVNNEVWQAGRGIVAARAMLADLKLVNAPIN